MIEHIGARSGDTGMNSICERHKVHTCPLKCADTAKMTREGILSHLEFNCTNMVLQCKYCKVEKARKHCVGKYHGPTACLPTLKDNYKSKLSQQKDL